jgi:hypothetical protein
MNHTDLDTAPGIAGGATSTQKCPPPIRHGLASWPHRPTDSLRRPIVTVFCTCDLEVSPPSYMPRLPG